LSLPHETPTHFLGKQDLRSRQLESDATPEHAVVGTKDNSVPSPANLVKDLESSDFADFDAQVWDSIALGKRVGASLPACGLRRGFGMQLFRFGRVAGVRHRHA
jgi:hypothetical protein